MAENKVDVFICGAGPVGLVLAYQLQRLGISTYIIDAADKASPEFPMYGRACTLYSRSLEMLDQLGLYDDLAQEGVSSAQLFTYREGQRVHSGGNTVFGDGSHTFVPFNLNLRLKYSEDIFRARLAEMNTFVHAPLKMVDYTVDENTGGEHKVAVTCETTKGEQVKVHAKYIVGADGGSSKVRKLSGIPFVGESHHNQHWVRIDGIVKTNIPEARTGAGLLETVAYGQVLWITLDHGATRIGFALTEKLFERYGYAMTQEQAVHEAKLAVAPFELEFEQVDWYTVYGIQQRVADRLIERERIILAGDAAHTHSSGSAQGMNTGMHDVVSLGWRLAGVMNGWYYKPVLQNYSDERRAVAKQLIENDKVISSLISGERPESLKDTSEDLMVLLRDFMNKIASFTNGLGISYPTNILNDTDSSLQSVLISPGQRGPDVAVRKPGRRDQNGVRVHELTSNNGKFHVLVFAGRPNQTGKALQVLRAQVDRSASPFTHAVDFLTLIEGNGKVLDEYLGVRKFGKGYWDTDSSAHHVYGAEENVGALVVLRPDGIVGVSAELVGFDTVIVPYFQGLIVPQIAERNEVKGQADIGELLSANENNLTYSRKRA